MTEKINKYLTHFLVALICVVLFGFIFLLKTGWKPNVHTTIGGGSVSITIPEAGTKLYVDNIEEHQIGKQNETYTVSGLADREYTFAVSKSGFWPWVKTVHPKKGESLSLHPFTVPVDQMPEEIKKDNPLWSTIHEKILERNSPSETNKRLSEDKNTAIWIDNNIIFAEWVGPKENTPSFLCKDGNCDSRLIVLSSQTNIRDVDFYKDWKNALVFSDETGVFVIEMEKEGTQNFQPIIRTGNPGFLIDGNTGIFVESEGKLFHLKY
jgi:hypothetical protein